MIFLTPSGLQLEIRLDLHRRPAFHLTDRSLLTVYHIVEIEILQAHSVQFQILFVRSQLGFHYDLLALDNLQNPANALDAARPEPQDIQKFPVQVKHLYENENQQ